MSSPGLLVQCSIQESRLKALRASPCRALNGNQIVPVMQTDLSGGLRVFDPASPWSDFANRITGASGLIQYVQGASWALTTGAADFAYEWCEEQHGIIIPNFLGGITGWPGSVSSCGGIAMGGPVSGAGSGWAATNHFGASNMACSGWELDLSDVTSAGGTDLCYAYRQRVWWTAVPLPSVHYVVVNLALKQWFANTPTGSITLTDANITIVSDSWQAPDGSDNILLESPFPSALPATSDFSQTWPGTSAYNSAHPTSPITSQWLSADANYNCLLLNGDLYQFLSNGNLILLTGVTIQPGDNWYAGGTRTGP